MYRDDPQSGIIYCVVFSICNLIVLIQFLVYRGRINKFHRLLNAGCYFVEDNIRWNRRKLYSVHPNNVDFRSGIPRIINPARIYR